MVHKGLDDAIVFNLVEIWRYFAVPEALHHLELPYLKTQLQQDFLLLLSTLLTDKSSRELCLGMDGCSKSCIVEKQLLPEET